MVRFAVDDVAPAGERLPTSPLRERYREALVIGGDAQTPVIEHGSTHPLLGAVGLAFAQHRPLVLSPDAVWLTIAQGVAQHVRLHAEALRGRLVRHQGKEVLSIEIDATPTDAASWASVVTAFRGLLAGQVGDGRARLFECDFSTSTDVDRLASQIVLLDAFSPYFSYWLFTICGIPTITLSGTVDDWRRIRARVDVIAELDLGFWCQSLIPIADQFVRAAEGDVDRAFWRRIYNPFDAYGGEVITGWITRLYPYVEAGGTFSTRNPMLDLPIDEPKQRTTATPRGYTGPGLRSDAIPATVSRVTIHVVDRGEQRDVELVAGVVAVTQDHDGALQPIAGWHLVQAAVPIREVAERIVREHRAVPVVPADRHRFHLQGPAEVIALFNLIDSAVLFDGDRAWHLRCPRDHQRVQIERGGQYSIRRIADLPGGRSLCAASNHSKGTVHWLVCRLREEAQPAPTEIPMFPGRAWALDRSSDIRVLGGSLADILGAALASTGDVEHLEVARFDQLLSSDARS